MKGRVFLFLFAIPFFGVGLWMTYSVGSNLADAWQMSDWDAVPATLTRAGYETHSGDDSNTYEVFASYTYAYNGQTYSSDRVGITGGSDNIGDYHTDLGSHLNRSMSNGEAVRIYVDPDNPADAVIDRGLRWGLIGFKSIFLFVFGGIGLGLIIFTLRAPKVKDMSSPEYLDRPWLANDDWQTAVMKSNSKFAMYFTWGFAAFWNLISAPLPFALYEEVTEKDNYLALIGLMFPLVGVMLIVWAVRRTLEWRRFGPAPLTLDPFPGSIGGHVGGTIEVNLPYDPAAQFSLTLTSLKSYVSGSGKQRRRNESAQWQDSQVAHTSMGRKGSRLSFRFDLPDDLTESDAEQSGDTYFLWRLNLKAQLSGVDIDRDYEIPVYATGESSRQLSEFSIQQARSEQSDIDVAAVKKLFQMSYDAGGRALLFPMGRNLLGGFLGAVFGAVFTGIGWYLVANVGHAMMGIIFVAVGLIVVLAALYSVFNSLEVMQDGDGIKSVRRVVGVPVKRSRMRRANFLKFVIKNTMQSQSGSKHVMHYSVQAVDRNGNKMVVGEGFKGVSQADSAALLIGREFALTSNEESSPVGDSNYNLLTTNS
jgi:hypothetical protein